MSFLYWVKHSLCCCCKSFDLLIFKGKILDVYRAPEPTDILWENLHKTFKDKTSARFKTAIATFFLLALSTVCIIVLSNFQEGLNHNDGSFFEKYLVGLVVINIEIYTIEFVIFIVLKKLASLEGHWTYTTFFKSNGSKLIWTYFLNSGIINLIVFFLQKRIAY